MQSKTGAARTLTGAEIALACAAVTAAVLGYYALEFESLDGFVEAIDHCDILFCDFENHFYPVGKGILVARRAVEPFVYPAFAALLFAGFGLFEYETARLLWGGLGLLLAVALFLLARPAPRREGLPLTLAYLLVFLTSVPLLHNAKWGQVSVAVTVSILACFHAYERGHVRAAALLLALGSAVKIYPAVFLLPFALRRDRRFLVTFALAVVVFVAVIPVAVLGLDATLGFHRQVGRWIEELTPDFLGRYNTQYVAAAVTRVFDGPFDPESDRALVLGAVCYALALANAAGVFWLQRGARGRVDPRVVALLFLLLPLVLPVTWPHYMVYLPFCQLVLARRALRASGARRAVALAAVVGSVALASVFAYVASGHWILFARRGFLAWADLALLVGYWVEAAPALRARPAAAERP